MSHARHEIAIDVFGATAAIAVSGRASDGTTPHVAALRAAATLRAVHVALTRFDEDSELSRLNADPRTVVPASPLLRRLARAVGEAGRATGGLVDGTQLAAVRRAGYDASRAAEDRDPSRRYAGPLLAAVGVGRPALPDPASEWQKVMVDEVAGTIVRPPGVQLDSGGLAKGIACDLVATRLARHPRFAVSCSGDLRVGGTARRQRPIEVLDPLGSAPVSQLRLVSGAVATSGVGRNWWLEPGGAVAHHLIDPGRGMPAFTGLLQATAVAPTALEAEIRAKAALLAGPADAAAHLPDGGVLVGALGEIVEVGQVASLDAVPGGRAA